MVAHQRCCGEPPHSLCKATSAASSLALSTYWPSYQKRAGTLMLPMWTLLDQAVRPPVRGKRKENQRQCSRRFKQS